jgi:hypothetical protein
VWRFLQALSPKQGVFRAEQAQTTKTDYATGLGNVRTIFLGLCDGGGQ